ncbi:hypothetical protein FRB99_004354, partial [Tulasnella sp. 403]
MPRAREHILELLDRYRDLQQSTKQLKETVDKLTAQIPVEQRQRTDEYISVKQAEKAVRDMEGKVAEARRKRDALRLRVHNLKNPGESASTGPSADTSVASTATWPSPGPQPALKSETLPSGLNYGNTRFSSVMQTPGPSSDPREQEFWGGSSTVQISVDTDEGNETIRNTLESDADVEEQEDAEDDRDDDDADETIVLSLHRRADDVEPSSPSRPILSLAEESSLTTSQEPSISSAAPPPPQEEPPAVVEEPSVTQDTSVFEEPPMFNPKLEQITKNTANANNGAKRIGGFVVDVEAAATAADLPSTGCIVATCPAAHGVIEK